MTVPVARKVYSAEELHRLRGAQSQPKLREAIEEHDGEDAEVVKDHVLRGTKSFAARSYRSRASAASLRVPSLRSNNENIAAHSELNRLSNSTISHAVLGEIVGNGQIIRPATRPGSQVLGPSPTPSMKKKKVQDLVKAHGSPTHVRVTAGGRIVPSEQSPLCHPRYGYSAVKVNGGLIKFAPNQHAGKPQWTQATENGFVAQDIHGNICQIVDGVIMPLDEVDGALRLHMHAPNLNITHDVLRGRTEPVITRPSGHQPEYGATTRVLEPSFESQIIALELEYSKLEQEEKEIDKTEVIHGRSMGKAAKDALWTKRRELVTNKDQLRKAIKALKSQPPPNAPTSPRAMHNRPSISPPRRHGVPPFLRMQPANGNLPVMPAGPYQSFVAGPLHFSAANDMQPTPSPEDIYAVQPWSVPPPSVFAQPRPFDGSMAPIQPFASAQTGGIRSTIETNIPQNDGAPPSTAHTIGGSPGRSHAVSIKAPESRPTANFKSALNPMSPAYKPSNTSSISAEQTECTKQQFSNPAATPLSPLHKLQRQDQSSSNNQSSVGDGTISSVKKGTHLQSSSIASFNTADFFPCNTREYSTRQHAYPSTGDCLDEKENTNPEQSTKLNSPLTPGHRARPIEACQANSNCSPQMRAPPGTPVYQDEMTGKHRPVVSEDSAQHDMPNRDTNNMSPKNKRNWLFIQEQPGAPSSSPEKSHRCQDGICGAGSPYDSIDFSQKPREWIEGYQAGLQRRPVGADRMGDFLDGYCSGLLKSRPSSITPSSAAPSTGSPVKVISRRHSPALPARTSSHLQLPEKALPGVSRPPFETNTHSLDTLKQAILAPQNKIAVLTPAADGPHVDETPMNLGAWARNQQTAPTDITSLSGFMHTALAASHQNVMSEPYTDGKISSHGLPPDAHAFSSSKGPFLQPADISTQPVSPALSTRSIASSSMLSGSAPDPGHRIGSLMSIESSMARQWPGNRVMTPTEWKSGSSVAHATSLATGYFANAQFDGTSDTIPILRLPGQLTETVSSTGANQQRQRIDSVMGHNTPHQGLLGRFREGSLDGLSSPPASPPPPMSPHFSPQGTPLRGGSRKDSTPGKGPSPAKAKFEHIAGKVGIKVTAMGKASDVSSFEPGSPPDKRRGGWRDIWRKGGRDGIE